jgi:hypothetical protein
MAYDWLHFAERSGDAGKAWAAMYRQHSDTARLSEAALLLMRNGDLEAGNGKLQEFATGVSSMGPIPESMRSVMDRWYYGLEGYYFYCVGDFDRAADSMDLAHRAVVRAISRADWLVMLSIHCQEFCLHQARVRRNQHHWPEMNACVDRARAMILDELPLCQTEQGRKITFSTLQEFFDGLAPLSDDETRALHPLLDTRERMRLFDKFVRRMFKFQNIGIEYP